MSVTQTLTSERSETGDESEQNQNAFLHPDHHLLQRFQQKLKKKLIAVQEKLALERREKEEAIKKLAQLKDQIGVELYGTQKELAKIQEGIQAAHAQLLESQERRAAAQQKLQAEQRRLYKQQQQLESERRQSLEYQKEIERINQSLLQVQQAHGEATSQISVAKREALKTEEDKGKLARAKQDQDLLIDKLNEQIKQLEERVAVYNAQYEAQARETAAARATLDDAVKEMEKIHFEKRQLLQQWRSALLAVQARDEALAAADKEIQARREQLQSIDGEISNYKKATAKEQAGNESLMSILKKMELEVVFLEKQIQKNQEREDAVKAELDQTHVLMEEAESEMAKVTIARRGLEERVNGLQKEGDIEVNKTVKIEETIEQNLQIQKTLEKSAASASQGASKLLAAVREKEMSIAELNNELARIQVDMQTQIAQNETLKETLQKAVSGLREKDSLIERYEVEIRRRTDEIERKQSEVDRLNKKYDSLATNVTDENMGPLEATIHNLTNEIAEKQRQANELQYYWLRSQTELVNLTKETEKQGEAIVEMERQLTVLAQKQLRTQSATDSTEHDIRELEVNVKNLQIDMQRLNGLISRNKQLQHMLVEGNLDLENEFQANLKRAEREAIELETKIDEMKEEKESIMLDIVEAERLVLLWEKKIALAKETQEAIDPNIGSGETQALNKEIQRMRNVLVDMKKQEAMLQLELERAVERRESVLMKNSPSKDSAKTAAQAQALADRRAREMKNRLKDTKNEAAMAQKAAGALRDHRSQLSEAVTDVQERMRALKKRESELLRDVDANNAYKSKQFELLTIYQKIAKKYSSLEADDMRDNNVSAELQKQQEQWSKVETIKRALIVEFPQLATQISQLFA